MIEALAKDTTRFANAGAPIEDEMTKMEKGGKRGREMALLFSGADKQQYRKLKDELANSYLLGTDQYPNTYEKGM